MKNEEESMKYTAFTPATWLIITQLLLVHWKIAYGLNIPWWAVLMPLEVAGLVLVCALLFYIIYYIVGLVGSKMGRKTFP